MSKNSKIRTFLNNYKKIRKSFCSSNDKKNIYNIFNNNGEDYTYNEIYKEITKNSKEELKTVNDFPYDLAFNAITDRELSLYNFALYKEYKNSDLLIIELDKHLYTTYIYNKSKKRFEKYSTHRALVVKHSIEKAYYCNITRKLKKRKCYNFKSDQSKLDSNEFISLELNSNEFNFNEFNYNEFNSNKINDIKFGNIYKVDISYYELFK